MSHVDTVAKSLGYVHSRGKFDHRAPNHTYNYIRPNRQPATVTFMVLGDAGNTRAAASVAAAFDQFRPQVILLAGLAGSLDPAQARLGDVFVIDMAKLLYADKIKELDQAHELLGPQPAIPSNGIAPDGRRMFDERKAAMGNSVLRYRRDLASDAVGSIMVASYMNGLASRKLLSLEGVTDQVLGAIPPAEVTRYVNANPEIRSGVVLASEMVIDSQPYIDFLQERNADEDIGWYAVHGGSEASARNPWVSGDMPIVDMESYGFFKFAETMGRSGVTLRAFAVRGVSDLAAGKAALDKSSKDQVRAIAARNATVVALDLLRALDAAELSSRP
ncbi:hypothetical protein [Methylorubrum populi]